MPDIEDAVDLRKMPPKTTRKLRLADPLLAHALVENHLDGGQGRHHRPIVTNRRGGDPLTAVNAGCNRLLEGVRGTSERLGRSSPKVVSSGKSGDVANTVASSDSRSIG